MTKRVQHSEAFKAYRKEVSRKASLANKRLRRLEKAGYHESPAYKSWKKQGGVNFGVAKKSYRELQKENARLDQFINSKTSSVRGSNKILKAIAKNTGIKYNKVSEIRSKASKFFRTASKVNEYLNSAGGGVAGASNAIGYQQIWKNINIYAQAGDDVDIETIAGKVIASYEVGNTPTDFDDPTGWHILGQELLLVIYIEKLDYSYIQDIAVNAKVIRTNKGYSYLNTVTSFDIETTSAMVNGEKVAFMYIWQFAVENIVVYGRTWEQFQEFLNKLHDIFQLTTNDRLICYIHNMGFEFQFMRKYLDITKVFAVAERKPIKVQTELGIEFRDSYILSGYSLETVAKNLVTHDVKKLVGYLDYDKIRTSKTKLTEKELEYCAYDVIIVVDYIHEQIDEFGDITRIPLTNTGRVRKFVKDNVYFTSTNHRKSDQGKYNKYRSLMMGMQLDSDTYKRLKKAFQGGYTHANANKAGKIISNVSSYDFTSSYPTVMLSEKFPMSSPFDMEIPDLETFNKVRYQYALLMDIRFENIQSKVEFDNYLSSSKCETKNAIINNGRVYSADYLQTTITNVDFEIIERTYSWDKIYIGKVQAFYINYLPVNIIKSILTLYKNKTELKGLTTNRAEYMRSKGMLNSMYGMCVTDIVQVNNTYENNEWVQKETDIDKDIKKYNNSKNRFLYYPWGVWVTAYARRNLWMGIIASGNDYCYSDTDSIKIEHGDSHKDFINKYNQMIIGKLTKMCEFHKIDPELTRPKNIKGTVKQIGIWDNEGTYDRFKTLGAKRYLFEKDGDLHLTVAGLSKKNGIEYMKRKCQNDFTKVFNFFNDDLYIPKEQTGKNTHTYIDDCKHFIISDYVGVPCEVKAESGIHLSKADFTLSISEQYGEFLKNLKDGYIFKGVEKVL